MKLKGKKANPNIDYCVFPRFEEDLVFCVNAVQDTSLFDKMCPMPQPPEKQLNTGERLKNWEDKYYLKALDAWAKKKESWYVIKSLEKNPDLTWEQVQLDDHTTWHLWKEEMIEFGLNEVEVQKIYTTMLRVNSLSEAALEQARKRFLASREAVVAQSSSPLDESNSTLSGEPASDGA